MAAEMKSGQKKWLWIFFTIDFLNKIVSHIFITIVGPAQPFLAKKIGVQIDEINWLWTFCEETILLQFHIKPYITFQLD